MFYQDKFETSAWGKIYSKNLFETGIRYPKGKLYEDLPTTYRLIEVSGKIAITSKVTTYYLIRRDSIQGGKFNKKKNVVLEIGTELLNYFSRREDFLYGAVCCRMLSVYFNIFFQIEEDNVWASEYWSRICALRSSVILNKKARKKARIAALISYLGPHISRLFYNLNMNK